MVSVSQPSSSSRRRSLVCDASRCLSQQLVFWGADVRSRTGNLLVAFGMERIPRTEVGCEGSSRYRTEWGGGVIELHSFCIGWYPAGSEGVLFIRNRERLHTCPSGCVIHPGTYDSVVGAAPDDLLPVARPLLAWVAGYERWVRATTRADYRFRCWDQLVARMGVRPWLPPDDALDWMERFVADPDSKPRPREWLRRRRPADRRPPRPAAGFSR